MIETLSSTEVHSLRMNLRAQTGASVISHQFIQLDSKFDHKFWVRKELPDQFLTFPFVGEARADIKFAAPSVEKAVESASNSRGVKYSQDNLQMVEDPIPCNGDACKNVLPYYFVS